MNEHDRYTEEKKSKQAGNRAKKSTVVMPVAHFESILETMRPPWVPRAPSEIAVVQALGCYAENSVLRYVILCLCLCLMSCLFLYTGLVLFHVKWFIR